MAHAHGADAQTIRRNRHFRRWRDCYRQADRPHPRRASYRVRRLSARAKLVRDQLGEALRGDAWGDDGNYSIARDVVWPGPRRWYGWTTRLHLVMWRLFWRTMRRGVLRKSYGTVAMRHFVTRDSLFLWALRSHWLRRRTMPAAFAQPDHSHLDVVHLRSPKTTREWIRTLMTRR